VPRGGEHVVSKKRFSAFWGTHLASLLRRLGAAHVVVAGVQTPNCVRATAFDAVAEDFADVSVLADATASATPAVQEANLADLRAAGVHTPTLGQWRASLAGPGLLGALFGR
jgi:nicotinamidase-related amidase